MGLDEDSLEESPYCSCGACGESGCCSPLICIAENMRKNSECKYGKGYLKELKLALSFTEWVLSTVDSRTTEELQGYITQKEVNRKYREMMDEIWIEKFNFRR